MDLRVKIQPKEIFIYSMYNFWAGLRGIGCIILTVLVIIAAAASEERLGTQVTNLVILGVIALTGFQIFAIGIIGEYIGKTYLETKKRPKYIIESVILDDKDISIDRNW